MAYGQPTTLDPTNVMGRRIGAWIIDVVVPTVIALAIGWTVFVGQATKISNVPTDYCSAVRVAQHGSACFQVGSDAYVGTSSMARHAFAVGGLIWLIGALNLFVLQGLTGAALGKHMLGLRVVNADGGLAGFGRNAFRTLMLVVDQFFCALPGIITASVTHPHRRVGDFAAGTFVVAREAVGTPIGTAMGGVQPYPPQWNPPPATWGPPAAGGAQPWGAPAPGWGTPPAQAPTPSAAPTTWGAPAPTEPVAQPAATEPIATEPVTTESAAPAKDPDAPGWALPASAQPQPQQQPPPAQHAPVPQRREPQWDEQRSAWVYWEAETNRWLQHDPATGQWGPLR